MGAAVIDMARTASITLIFCLALAAGPACGKEKLTGCAFAGKALQGRVRVVASFPDFKVKLVTSFADLKVQRVTSFPDSCGKWQLVDSFPDFTVQFVDSFPDFAIEYVDSFPGVR